MSSRVFHKGGGGLLKQACSRVCAQFRTSFYQDEEVPIYKDEYGWIAIPITDGFQKFYLMARSYLLEGHISSIEKKLIDDAYQRKMRFIMWVKEIDRWYIIDPKSILITVNHKISMRGTDEYLDFEPEKLKESYQIRFKEEKRTK